MDEMDREDDTGDNRSRVDSKNREAPVGILRLDIGKPRRSSVEFKFLSQVIFFKDLLQFSFKRHKQIEKDWKLVFFS